jgi:hypothetical protein
MSTKTEIDNRIYGRSNDMREKDEIEKRGERTRDLVLENSDPDFLNKSSNILTWQVNIDQVLNTLRAVDKL